MVNVEVTTKGLIVVVETFFFVRQIFQERGTTIIQFILIVIIILHIDILHYIYVIKWQKRIARYAYAQWITWETIELYH